MSLCSEGSAQSRAQWSEDWLSWNKDVYLWEAGVCTRSAVLLLVFSRHQMTGSCIPVCHWLSAASPFSALVSPPERGVIITSALYFSPFMKFINHKMLDWNWRRLQLLWVVSSCSFPMFLLVKKPPFPFPVASLFICPRVACALCTLCLCCALSLLSTQYVKLQFKRSLSSISSIKTMGYIFPWCRDVYHLYIP